MLESIANKVANNLVTEGEDKQLALDPTTIYTLIELISGIITMFKNCKQSPAQAKQKINTPSFRDRVAVKMFVRRELGGFRDYRQNNGDKITAALLNTGKSLTQDEVDKAFLEV